MKYVKIENYSENIATTTLLSSRCFIFQFLHFCVWMWFDVLFFDHHRCFWFSLQFFSLLTHSCWWLTWRRATDWCQRLFFLIWYTSWCLLILLLFSYLFNFFCFDNLKDLILLFLFWLFLKLCSWLRTHIPSIMTVFKLFLDILVIFFDFIHLRLWINY